MKSSTVQGVKMYKFQETLLSEMVRVPKDIDIGLRNNRINVICVYTVKHNYIYYYYIDSLLH